MKKLLLAAALSFSFSFSIPAMAEQQGRAHWGYTGAGAAHNWAYLSDDYHACKGKKQSPINIEQYGQNPNLAPVLPGYKPSPLDIVNNGHTLQVNFAPGSQMSVGGKVYNLLQFHFHTPSEHYLDGAPYPMELHLVHQNPEDKELAVVGVMIKIGAHNKVIEAIWQNAPVIGGHRKIDAFSLLASDLLPSNMAYYKYEGSLTTPPCSEGVQWHLLQTPIEISEDQLRTFQSLFPMNARPVQPLNGRQVTGQ